MAGKSSASDGFSLAGAARSRRGWRRWAALAVVCLAAVSCYSPSAPLIGSITVVIAPPDKIATLMGFAPFQWTLGWTVNVLATGSTPSAALVDRVTSRIEAADGTALFEITSVVRQRPRPEVPVQVPQTGVWNSPATPPATARLIVTVFLVDGNRTEQLQAFAVIDESLCGLRGQVPCSGATIGVAQGVVSPQNVEVLLGQFVSFSNFDGVAYSFRSDPHPAHSACPPLNGVDLDAFLNDDTEPFLTPGTCTFHAEADPGNAALQGEIVVRLPPFPLRLSPFPASAATGASFDGLRNAIDEGSS